MIESTQDAAPEAIEATVGDAAATRPGFDYMVVVQSPAFIPGLAATLGIIALYWGMIKFLPTLWMSEDGYYSHGFLVPLISAYVVYKNWPKLKDRPVRPQWWAAIPLVALLFVAYLAAATNIYGIAAVALISTIMVSTLFVAGWQWTAGLFWPIAYLGWCLPLFQRLIDTYTNWIQIASTKVAYELLNLSGFQPYAEDMTTINLPRFTLNIAVPCSGMKLLVALGAFTMFFMLVANLKWVGNLIMVALWIPLALVINGLRIALIGVVGNQWGHEAGMKFHDYSGYLTLLICFFILFRVARGLGWKD